MCFVSVCVLAVPGLILKRRTAEQKPAEDSWLREIKGKTDRRIL